MVKKLLRMRCKVIVRAGMRSRGERIRLRRFISVVMSRW